jgi:hypothetical protein
MVVVRSRVRSQAKQIVEHMEAMVVDAPSSPALPYLHPASPAEAVTPPPKMRSRSPLPSPLQVPGGCSLHELLLLSPHPPSSRRHRSRTRGAGLDDSLEMAAGTPRRRRRGAVEQRAAPALPSPRNARRARRRLEKDVEADEDAAAARKARRRKSAMALAPKLAVVVADKAAVAEKGEDTSLALVPAPPDATHSKHISIRSIRL